MVGLFGSGVGGERMRWVIAAQYGGQGEVYWCWVAVLVGGYEGDVGNEGGGDDGMDGLVVVGSWEVSRVSLCIEDWRTGLQTYLCVCIP
jgi:hypothetical protein